jgi:uncharacterized protein
VKTLVIGASENTQRYSYKAIQSLVKNKIPLEALGFKQGQVGDVIIHKDHFLFTDIDTITLYINPSVQQQYYDYILALQPRRVIFNPGTENENFAEILHQNGIIAQDACTLVLLSIGAY